MVVCFSSTRKLIQRNPSSQGGEWQRWDLDPGASDSTGPKDVKKLFIRTQSPRAKGDIAWPSQRGVSDPQ